MEPAYDATLPGLTLMGPGDLVPRWFDERRDFDPAYTQEVNRRPARRALTGPLALARSLG